MNHQRFDQDTQARLDHIVKTWCIHTSAQQAEALGITTYAADETRREALRRGLVSKSTRFYNPIWTQTEIDQLINLIRQGESLVFISKAMGKTLRSIRSAMERRGMSLDELREGYVWELKRVATMLGVSWHKAKRWVKRGFLVTKRNGTYGGTIKLITRAHLADFLRDKRAWPFYNPDDIQDSGWRTFAWRARQAAQGRWVRATEFSRTRHYCPGWAADRIREGKFPEEHMKVAGVWYVWERG